jgi:hypothetical protein
MLGDLVGKCIPILVRWPRGSECQTTPGELSAGGSTSPTQRSGSSCWVVDMNASVDGAKYLRIASCQAKPEQGINNLLTPGQNWRAQFNTLKHRLAIVKNFDGNRRKPDSITEVIGTKHPRASSIGPD